MKIDRQKAITAGAAAGALAVMLAAGVLLPERIPTRAYEGEAVLGYTIPPKMFAIVEQNPPSSSFGTANARPACTPDVSNPPCYLTVFGSNNMTVRLYLYPCLDSRDVVRFDENCENQRAFDERAGLLK